MYFWEMKKMCRKILSTILFLCLAFMTACVRATPIPTLELPTATTNPVFTSTPSVPTSTLPPTAVPLVQPSATSIVTPTENPVMLKEPTWKFATGAPIWGSITVSNGIVYFGSDDGFVYAVDTQSYALKWKYQTEGIVCSRVTVSNNLVYTASDDGYLYTLSSDTGRLVWKIQIGDPTPKSN
jgi:outer membrane protein assembly factor BamB